VQDITERKRLEAALQAMATTDDLTGLANRRHFLARLAEEHARLQRQDTQRAVVLMLDWDHFKAINDTFGHAAGDAVLRHGAALMRDSLRKIDQVGRIGGEEFAILLSGADRAAAQVFAERLRQKVANTPVLYENRSIPVTVSIGITALTAQDATVDAVLRRADAALYRAKTEGRNRVMLADE
jgi:diguanylate cyclase (GGDEF)-like protein